MTDQTGPAPKQVADADRLSAYRDDLRGAERSVSGKVHVGNTLAPIALCLMLIAASYLLPHSGPVTGWDVLLDNAAAQANGTRLPERISMVLRLLTIVLVIAALVWRHVIVGFITWIIGGINMWYAFAGGWMRQSRMPEDPGAGMGFGLWLAIVASVALFIGVSFLVFRKSSLQSALALARREEVDSDPVLRAQQIYLRSGLTPNTQTETHMVDDRREAARRRRAAKAEAERKPDEA